MWRVFLVYLVEYGFYLFLFYSLNAVLFLYFARIEKDSNGRLILDAKSWHFKAAHPFLRYDRRLRTRLEERGVSLCPYFAKLFLMLYIGLPILAVWRVVLTTIVSLFSFIFGYYTLPWEFDDHPIEYPLNVVMREISFPEIKGVRLVPAWVILPALYIWSLFEFHKVRVISLGLVGLVVVIILIVALVSFLKKPEDDEEVSLAREWIQAKKQGICPPVDIKNLEL